MIDFYHFLEFLNVNILYASHEYIVYDFYIIDINFITNKRSFNLSNT